MINSNASSNINNINDVSNLNGMHNPMEKYLKMDYKVPLNPISENKNVISSAPVLNNMNPNLMNAGINGIINPQNNTYYNTYINPYAYNTPGFQYLNMMKQQLAPGQRTYMGNILPNNFQGKIPINQYGGYPNMYSVYPSKILICLNIY